MKDTINECIDKINDTIIMVDRMVDLRGIDKSACSIEIIQKLSSLKEALISLMSGEDK